MAFLGGLALLGSATEAEQRLKTQQAIAMAHMQAAQRQQQSQDLGAMMSLLTGDPMASLGLPGGGMPPGGAPGGPPMGGGAPPPGPQMPPGGAPQGAAGPPGGAPQAAAPPPQQPAAQVGQIPQGQGGPLPSQPPGPQGVSFDQRFNAVGPQPQGATVDAKPVKTQTIGGQGAPQPGKLYNTASPQDQAKYSGQPQQPQGQQVAQQSVQDVIQRAQRSNDPNVRAIVSDPARLERVMPALQKAMELKRMHDQQIMNQNRSASDRERHERRMEQEFNIRDEERREAAAKKAADEKEKKEAKKEKEDAHKAEIDQLVEGLRKGPTGQYSTSTSSLRGKERNEVMAEAVKRGINFRLIEQEQKQEDAYNMSAGRAGGTIGARVEFSARELAQAIPQVRETSANLPRGEFVPYNQIKQYFQKAVGDPALNDHVIALKTARNAYARAMNPMGVPRQTENAELRFDNIMQSAVGPKATEVQLERLWKEAQQMQRAAAGMKPGAHEPIPDLPSDPNKEISFAGDKVEGFGESPNAPPSNMLQEGVNTTFKGGRGTWTLQNGKPVRVDQ